MDTRQTPLPNPHPQTNRLLDTETLRKLGRPIGKVDNLKLDAYIAEIEHLYVKAKLGDALYMDLLEKKDSTEEYKILLNGGTYQNCKDDTFMIAGLRTAISYYVYAKYVMNGDFESTRYGMVMKESEYSNHLSDKNRSSCYNDALEMANSYMQECILYCKEKGLIKATKSRPTNGGGITIRKIG